MVQKPFGFLAMDWYTIAVSVRNSRSHSDNQDQKLSKRLNYGAFKFREQASGCMTVCPCCPGFASSGTWMVALCDSIEPI